MFPTKDYPYTYNDPDCGNLMDFTPEEKVRHLERMKLTGRMLTNVYMTNCWIENDETGFTGWRWDKYKVPLRLVSAANRYKDIIICAPRHGSP